MKPRISTPEDEQRLREARDMQLYKVLGEGQTSYHGGSGKWTKNRWRSVSGEVVPCVNGLHLCRRQDLVGWLGPQIWEVEADESGLVEANDKVVVRRARIVRRLDTWNERSARLFAADCAEKVLPIFEKQYPNDGRPRKAIEAARAFADGKITRADLDAAGAAAGAAAWDAAWAAARAAARDAARGAAWDAARAAVGAVAGAAAWDAAWDAARAAARDAARDEFMQWATDRLFDYLEGRVA
jgi:hypothetical protein